MFTRHVGEIEVSALGMGCWAIGGPYNRIREDGTEAPMGWGDIDDHESIRAIHAAIDHGVNLFDTANNYGAGHSETILGQAVKDRRDQVVIATKFASVFDEAKKLHYDTPATIDEPFIRDALAGSLRRLQTDYIDLYQFHDSGYAPEEAPAVADILETLVSEGKIRAYGWSTDHIDRARVFAPYPHCAAIQFRLNVLVDAPDMLAVLDEFDLGGLNKSPLNAAILTGKFTADSTFPANDGRSAIDFKAERIAALLAKVEGVRDILTSNGRTMAQGALAWIWARHDRVIPIPGFKMVQQAEENAKALDFGPLTPDQMRTIDAILER